MLNKLTNLTKLNKNSTEEVQLDLSRVPNHVAVIMDGNGRWAKKRGLPRIAGHREGMKVVRKVVKRANQIGVKALTMYAFSTENWKRPKPEVEFIMKLPEQFLLTYLPELIEENVQVRIMGEKEGIPSYTLKAVHEAVERTKMNNGLILNFALNYGSRYEITQAVKRLSSDIEQGKFTSEEVDEQKLGSYMMSNEIGDPELLIRTSGELRLSNFMLWQLAYTELWFTDIYWPDFKETDLDQAIYDYQNRGRRFGGV
ncbi:isoprenyl transferase [Pseudalkalibacillus berkeleyi]|uniref:Isoprenyl transferase n=1 Tax=Pseudalkalibacillus berkeleyi TaxID=1069813 RepID=A0ABS9GWR8_9BACL|nr:isoprenyl transferase [Pseudalkalibacillus berkeleyi]MCF6137139.1 isoprenyl transferase [Pseudalkalibacillus berkeleyi]